MTSFKRFIKAGLTLRYELVDGNVSISKAWVNAITEEATVYLEGSRMEQYLKVQELVDAYNATATDTGIRVDRCFAVDSRTGEGRLDYGAFMLNTSGR